MPKKPSRADMVAREVRTFLAEGLPQGHFYHDMEHAKEVSLWAGTLGTEEHVSAQEVEILRVAGLLHDVGHTERYDNNEPAGARIAGFMLARFDFTPAEIGEVQSLILATSMPQRPVTLLQKIICDSDLANLGLPDHFRHSVLLRKEYGVVKKLQFTDREWNERQEKFVSGHSYFTRSAQSMLGPGQEKNLEAYREALRDKKEPAPVKVK